MDFQVIIDDAFSLIAKESLLSPKENKRVLSIINDFQNGSWHSERFQKFIWNNIKETALNYRERRALIDEGEDSILTEAAKNLRLSDSENDVGKGSEIAEILLYGIMKNHYKALPIVPKIFYKQNRNDYAKGADSVHIVIENDKEFSLWLGESKFYDSIENSRLGKIVASVKDGLSLEKLRKENSIITGLSDINELDGISPTMKENIVNMLSKKVSIDNIKPILNIPILLLHECEITKNQTHMNGEYIESIKNHHKDRATEYFTHQIKECADVDMYSAIKFHIILFPVPNKKPIVDKFIKKANAFRN